MISERLDKKQPLGRSTTQLSERERIAQRAEERARATLALLLGPETESAARAQAIRYLVRQGARVLPLILATLSQYPEITSPSWPSHPPQYEQCGRLLLGLCRKMAIRLNTLLSHPAISQPPGPVLWTGVLEAASLQYNEDDEELFRQGLNAPWISVRYTAAIELAGRANKVCLRQATIDTLYRVLCEDKAFPVRLAASYSLLTSGKSAAVEALLPLLDRPPSPEARKATAFILAQVQPLHFSRSQRERITQSLLAVLCDPNIDVALHAGQALCNIASASVLPSLYSMLETPGLQIVALTTLEEMTRKNHLRHAMQHQGLPAYLVPLLQAEDEEVRRQTCYTLAGCEGEYALAALGTIVMDWTHPSHIQAIEALRLIHGALQDPTRLRIIQWLLNILDQSGTQELVQVVALDSLTYLLWQARKQRLGWQSMSKEIIHSGKIVHSLHNPSAWVRQRAAELLGMLPPSIAATQQDILLQCLHTDIDSGVRACAAHICGKIAAHWAIPDLLQALHDPDEHVAVTALCVLGHLATPNHAEVLHTMECLAAGQQIQNYVKHSLVQAAQELLTKWRKVAQRRERKAK